MDELELARLQAEAEAEAELELEREEATKRPGKTGFWAGAREGVTGDLSQFGENAVYGLGGAAIGAGLGSVALPGVGTAIGGLAGAKLGSAVGAGVKGIKDLYSAYANAPEGGGAEVVTRGLASTGGAIAGGLLGYPVAGPAIGGAAGDFLANQALQYFGKAPDNSIMYDLGQASGSAVTGAALGKGIQAGGKALTGASNDLRLQEKMRTDPLYASTTVGIANDPIRGESAQAKSFNAAMPTVDKYNVFDTTNPAPRLNEFAAAADAAKEALLTEREGILGAIDQKVDGASLKKTKAVKQRLDKIEAKRRSGIPGAKEEAAAEMALLKEALVRPKELTAAELQAAISVAGEQQKAAGKFNPGAMTPQDKAALETKIGITETIQNANRELLDTLPGGKRINEISRETGDLINVSEQLQAAQARVSNSEIQINANDAGTVPQGGASIGTSGNFYTRLTPLFSKVGDALHLTSTDGRVKRLQTKQNIEVSRKLGEQSRIRQGQERQLTSAQQKAQGIFGALATSNMVQAAVPSTFGTSELMYAPEAVAEEIFTQASQPLLGESPETAQARAGALASDLMMVAQTGTQKQKRVMIATLQDQGLLPPNPIRGEVDGYIELPEHRQSFIQDRKVDLVEGKIDLLSYIKQINVMSDPSNGRIIKNASTPEDATERLRQTSEMYAPIGEDPYSTEIEINGPGQILPDQGF